MPVSREVREIVTKQVAAGIDSVCDGELGKISYTFYVRHRLSGITAFRGGGIDAPPQTAAHRDLLDRSVGSRRPPTRSVERCRKKVFGLEHDSMARLGK